MSKADRTVKPAGKHPNRWEPKSPYGPVSSKAKPVGVVMNRRSK